MPAPELAERVTRLLAADRLPEAAVKIVCYRELNRTAELITARTLPYSAPDYLRGFRVMTLRQGERDGRLTGLKTLNYLENRLARQTARAADFDEALFVTPAGQVLEGSASTLFIVKDGHAPMLSQLKSLSINWSDCWGGDWLVFKYANSSLIGILEIA